MGRPAIRTEGADEAVRDVVALDDADARRRRGRGVRVPRAERRRQVDDAAAAARVDQTDRRSGRDQGHRRRRARPTSTATSPTCPATSACGRGSPARSAWSCSPDCRAASTRPTAPSSSNGSNSICRSASRAYSKGNRQKVALVAAFSRRPDVLLLDEPTSGLDPLMEQEFRRCVHEATERGQTIFLSSHILSEVEELCARVGILRAGKLVEVSSVDVAAPDAHDRVRHRLRRRAARSRRVDGVESVEPHTERSAGAAERFASRPCSLRSSTPTSPRCDRRRRRSRRSSSPTTARHRRPADR